MCNLFFLIFVKVVVFEIKILRFIRILVVVKVFKVFVLIVVFFFVVVDIDWGNMFFKVLFIFCICKKYLLFEVRVFILRVLKLLIMVLILWIVLIVFLFLGLVLCLDFDCWKVIILFWSWSIFCFSGINNVFILK